MPLQDAMHNISQLLTYDSAEPLIFSSGLFWAMFLLFLPIFGMLRSRRTMMLVFMVAFSLYFYYKCSGWFVLMLAATSLIDWGLSKAMAASGKKGVRLLCLLSSLAFSLGVLAYFKYANFFLWNWTAMVQGNFQPLNIILPVGISFYTFQSVSYMVDVYKGRIEPARTWLHYAFYLTYFPALVAGPIVRADYFLPQIDRSEHATADEMYAGLWMAMLGVLKKAAIADYIAQYNDLVFDSPGAYSGFETLMGSIGYAMQIYCDFSGYSDMAIGLSLIMGFKLATNFNFPYKSTNLAEFWHRWHISLSTWLRDYVYIPLGGNRKGTLRTYANNFLTMLIGGLWHGAAWKFVFWGAMHGAGLALHKACKPWLDRLPDAWWVKACSWLLTISAVCLLWIFFRAASFTDACTIISTIFTRFDPATILPFISTRCLWCVMMAIIIAAHAVPTSWWARASELFVRSPWVCKLALLLVVVQAAVQLRGEDVAPFIYFQF